MRSNNVVARLVKTVNMRTLTMSSQGLCLDCPSGGIRVIFRPDSRSWRTRGWLTRGPGKVIGIMALSLLNPAALAASSDKPGPDDRALLARYARDTWHSIESLSATG